MKKILLLVTAIFGIFAMTGCETTVTKPEDEEKVTVAPAPQIDLEQTTAQHKSAAYRSFMEAGGTMTAFYNDALQTFDLDDFLKTLGLVYSVTDGNIAILPNVPYAPDDDFEYIIHFTDDMVRGHDMFVGRNDDGGWSMSERYDSATDFIFQMSLNRQVYQIGADEFDQMYSHLRILTTPPELLDEVNKAIGAELEYSE